MHKCPTVITLLKYKYAFLYTTCGNSATLMLVLCKTDMLTVDLLWSWRRIELYDPVDHGMSTPLDMTSVHINTLNCILCCYNLWFCCHNIYCMVRSTNLGVYVMQCTRINCGWQSPLATGSTCVGWGWPSSWAWLPAIVSTIFLHLHNNCMMAISHSISTILSYLPKQRMWNSLILFLLA